MGSTVLQLTRVLALRPTANLPAGIRLRTFTGDEDVARWLEIRHRAFARQRLGVAGWTSDDFDREFRRKSWWRPQHLWFAESVGVPEEPPDAVGTVTLAFRGGAASAKPVVHWLAVLPQWRRKGVARALMTALEGRCWDLGYRQVWLETHSAWQDAVEMYRRLGYVSTKAG